MSIENFEKQISSAKVDIYTGRSLLQILNHLNQLISEGNRILKINPTFFMSIIREFNAGLVIRISRSFEEGPRSNIHETVRLAKKYLYSLSQGKQERVTIAIQKLETISKSDFVKKNRKFRHAVIAHLAKDKSEIIDESLPYKKFEEVFKSTGEQLNVISGAFFDTGTDMKISMDDQTLEQFQRLEKAENAFTFLERFDPENPALEFQIGKPLKTKKG